jgi:hypothetical protein
MQMAVTTVGFYNRICVIVGVILNAVYYSVSDPRNIFPSTAQMLIWPYLEYMFENYKNKREIISSTYNRLRHNPYCPC